MLGHMRGKGRKDGRSQLPDALRRPRIDDLNGTKVKRPLGAGMAPLAEAAGIGEGAAAGALACISHQ